MEHLGEAAGVAAAMACSLHLLPREVPVLKLQYELVKSGVLRASDATGQTITEGPEQEQLRRQDLWRKEREKVFPPASAGGIISLEKAVLFLGTDKAQEAMLQLYLAGDKSLPLLRPLLGSKNHLVHEEVAVVLGLLGDRSAVPALIEFLKERNTRRFEYKLPQASSRPSVPLYWTAVILLGRFGEKDAVPEMLSLLALSPPPEELGKLQRTAYGVDMFQSIDKCPPSLASFIIVALGRIGDPKAADAVRPFLRVSNRTGINKENNDFEIAWGVKTNAAWALYRMGENSGVPALIELLEADQALVRDYAGRLLEKIKF
jgi:hypothetical protein